MATTKRKLRLSKPSGISQKEMDMGIKRKLNKCLRDFNDAAAELARLQGIMQAARKEAQEILDKQGIRSYVNGDDVAEFEQKMGRARSSIDVRKFRKACKNDDDFMDACSVIQKEAEKILSGAELEKITTVTPAQPKEPVFVIHRKK